MNMLLRAQRDIKRFTSDPEGWTRSITLISRVDAVTVTLSGLHTVHHLSVDAAYQKFASFKNGHIAIAEDILVAAGYPVRNAEGSVDMMGDLVRVMDSTGLVKEYRIQQSFPDETIALITIILEDYKAVVAPTNGISLEDGSGVIELEESTDIIIQE